jgi:hypothetical protein
MRQVLFFLLLFGFSNALPAQGLLPELSWQAHPFTQAGAAHALDDGGFFWITETPHWEPSQDPIVARFDVMGQLLWQKTLALWDYPQYFEPTEIHRLSNGNFRVSYFSFDCDFPSPPGFLELDEDGELLSHWELGLYEPALRLSHILEAGFEQFQVGWAGELGGPGGMSLVMINHLAQSITPQGVQVITYKHTPALTPWAPGQILLGMPQGGLGLWDIAQQAWMDTLLHGETPIYDALVLPDASILVAGRKVLLRLTPQGDTLAIQPKLFCDPIQLWEAAGLFCAYCRYSDSLTTLKLFDLNLEEVAEVIPFSEDTRIFGLLPGANRHWVWGNETHNAFAKAILLDGSTAPMEYDAALTDFSYTDIQALVEVMPDPSYKKYDVVFKGFQVYIENTGLLPLDSVRVNYTGKLIPPIAALCTPFSEEVLLTSLGLQPGEGGWYALPDVLYKGPILQQDLSSIEVYVCMEVSCPNDKVDFLHANDRYCRQEQVMFTSTQTVDAQNDIALWPNPFSDRLYLDRLPPGAHQARLVDLKGRELGVWPLDGSPSATLATGALPSGMHTLTLYSAQGNLLATRQVVKGE